MNIDVTSPDVCYLGLGRDDALIICTIAVLFHQHLGAATDYGLNQTWPLLTLIKKLGLQKCEQGLVELVVFFLTDG